MEPRAPSAPGRDDRITPLTRLVSGLLIPFLVVAFAILYFLPGETEQRFAWEIMPEMTSAYMGAGYLSGVYLFSHALLGKRWRRISQAFLPTWAFTVAMLLTTILHWERFDLSHLPFQVWLALYILTPILLLLVWLQNRSADPGVPEPGDVAVPQPVRYLLAVIGIVLVVYGAFNFFRPDAAIQSWPWALTPLTARVMSGWFLLLGVGGVLIAWESRWSAWRAGMEAILLWHLLVLAAAARFPHSFKDGNPFNWYVLVVAAGVVGMLAVYLIMETRRRQSLAQPPTG